MMRAFALGVLGLAFAAVAAAFGAGSEREPADDYAKTDGPGWWDYYGGDQGGTRFSWASQITPSNVDDLVQVWAYSTGDLAKRDPAIMKRAKLQATPILVGDKLVLCSSFNEVIALDPGSGKEVWRFDPKIATDGVHPANGFNCRGVAVAYSGGLYSDRDFYRFFFATNDGRLFAVEDDGHLKSDFGTNGGVRIDPGVELRWPGEFQITSAPVVVGDVVIVGSAIGDNARVKAPFGTARAFDVDTGRLKWSWDPVMRDPKNPETAKNWGEGYRDVGHANVWAPMSVDEARGLVFMPTSSPSPDFFGGLRPGDNKYANSVVALKAATGELVWSFQTVHHDVWDYDNPAQPTLATIDVDGKPHDVVIQPTKQGLVFVLDRDTGVPVFPVEERAVPQGGAPGEALSPTQPFPTRIASLAPSALTQDDAYGLTPWDRGKCREMIANARHEGLYTPPSEKGTILFPFTGGGVNWGGITVDPVNQVMYANTSRLMHRITLFPAAKYEAMKAAYPDKEVSPQRGAPFGMIRETLLSPLGLPCNRPPWGVLTAVDLKSGHVMWEKRLGTTEELAPLSLALPTGTPTLGGSIVTAGGLVFIGATADRYLRAFDAKTGDELWQGRLPAVGMATPMTYMWKDRQYVVVAAGGRADIGLPAGDTFVAFALPKPGEAKGTYWSRHIDRPGGRMWINLTLLAVGVVVVVAGLWWLIRRWRR